MVVTHEVVDKALSVFYNKNTKKAYRSQLEPLIGEKVDRDWLANWVDSWGESSRATIIVRVAALRALFSYLESRGLSDGSLSSFLKKTRVPTGKPAVVREAASDNDIGKLLAATQTTREKALILVLVNTGLRLGTVPTLKYDLAFGKVSVQTKRSRQITVYPNDSVKYILKILMEEEGASRDDYIFGRTYLALHREFRAIADRAGVDIVPHQIRHRFATTLDANGTSIVVISVLMGHKSVGTTARYIHPNEGAMWTAVQKTTNGGIAL